MTKLQLLQFLVCFSHPVAAWLYGPECGYPDFLKALMVLYQLSMIVLFAQFYARSYSAKGKKGGEDEIIPGDPSA